MNLVDQWSQMRPDRISRVVVDGTIAGVAAALVVLLVFSVYDAVTTEWMRTPSVLHALFFDGPGVAARTDTEPVRAIAYTVLHFSVWICTGILAAYLTALSRVFSSFWTIAVAGPAVVLCLILWAAGVWGVPGLGIHHLWSGAALGIAAMGGFFLWRNPNLLRPSE